MTIEDPTPGPGEGGQDVQTDPEPKLSAAERSIITLVCLGLKDEQIAAHLHQSGEQVQEQLRSIFTKLSVENRLDLIIYAFAHGLIPRYDGKPTEQ